MRTGVGTDATDKAQADPEGALVADIKSVADGKVPSRQDLEAAVVAIALLAGAQPEFVSALVLVAALVEGLAWIEQTLLGGGQSWCDHPPIDSNDVRWLHFGDPTSSSWPPGTIPLGPWQSPAPGSFEAFALPILAVNWEYELNCRAYLDYREVLDRLAAVWNKTHPPLPSDSPIDTKAYQLPYVATDAGQRMPWPTAATIVDGPPLQNLPPWKKSVALPFLDGKSVVFTGDHLITVNRGAAAGILRLPPGGLPLPDRKPKPMSTGAKFAVGAASVGLLALIGSAIVAYAKSETIGAVWKGAWKQTKKVLSR